jgi:anthranilate phosphoribosyltransferase
VPSRRTEEIKVSFAHYAKRIIRLGGADTLSEDEAHDLFCAMLDGGVPDLELGAMLAALRMRGETAGELLGFQRAATERLYGLRRPDRATAPLVVPAFGGAREEPNLLALIGLLLRRLGVPVLFHGTLEGGGRIATVYILREFGIMPSASLAQAQAMLEEQSIAFVPTAALCPGLATLLALRNRIGVRSSAHVVAKLLDPFAGEGVLMLGSSQAIQLERLGSVLATTGARALLLASTEGEPFAHPRRRPRMEFFDQGQRTVLFEEEVGPVKPVPGLPPATDAHTTAAWMRHALAGETPIPHPLVNQLACCLYACGYTDDMNQAKAIAAVEAGSLAHGGRRRTPTARPVGAAPR